MALIWREGQDRMSNIKVNHENCSWKEIRDQRSESQRSRPKVDSKDFWSLKLMSLFEKKRSDSSHQVKAKGQVRRSRLVNVKGTMCKRVLSSRSAKSKSKFLVFLPYSLVGGSPHGCFHYLNTCAPVLQIIAIKTIFSVLLTELEYLSFNFSLL